MAELDPECEIYLNCLTFCFHLKTIFLQIIHNRRIPEGM